MTTAKRKKPNYRYAVIPAAAITDQAITPRDLQVLCLLGRHTDENGWCRRSQVKMAEELSCGRATVQRALERLYEAGYVQRRAEGRPGVEVVPDGHPFAAYSYRVKLDPEEDSEDDGGAQKRAPGVPTDEHGVPTQDGHGVPISRAPLIEHSLSEHSPYEQNARARARDAGGAHAPGSGSNRRPDPNQRELMMPVSGGRSAENRSSGAKSEPSTRITEHSLPDWRDRERLARAGFSQAEIGTWFEETTFVVDDGELVVTVTKPFKRNWIANHFSARLERAFRPEFGPLEVRVKMAEVA